MRAEELVALAAAHGIDLTKSAPPKSARRKRDTAKRRFTSGRRATVLLPPAEMMARGIGTRTDERPYWTLAEIGQAAAGVPEVPFMAACFAFAGESSYYWRLWFALHFEAMRLARHEDWPAQIRGIDGKPRFYFSELAMLVLDVDAHPSFFILAPPLYAIYMQIESALWNRVISKRFAALQEKWFIWLETARTIMQPRLREFEFEAET